MRKRVFIGVGHGGSDTGAIGKVTEKEANLTIAMEVKRILEAAGVTVGISRTKDEEDSLTEEIRECNAFGPDLAVEIHNNAGGGDGFECWVQTGEFATQSRVAAQAIEARVKAMGQASRGLKIKRNSAGTADYFGWLRQVKAPAVLCEGFFVDSADAADFDTAEEQKKLARAYAQGIADYLNIKLKEDKVVFRTYDDVPTWGKEAIKAVMDKGALRGTGDGEINVSEDLVRMLVILHRLGVI